MNIRGMFALAVLSGVFLNGATGSSELMVKSNQKAPSNEEQSIEPLVDEVKKTTVQIDADSVIVVTVDPNGNLKILDRKGEVIKPCKLCTPELEEKLGPKCKNAKSGYNICEGTVDTTVQRINPVSFMVSPGSRCVNVSTAGGNHNSCLSILQACLANPNLQAHQPWKTWCPRCFRNRNDPICK